MEIKKRKLVEIADTLDWVRYTIEDYIGALEEQEYADSEFRPVIKKLALITSQIDEVI